MNKLIHHVVLYALFCSFFFSSIDVEAQNQPQVMTVDLNQRGGVLTKAGLGSLFGLSRLGSPPDKKLIDGSTIAIVTHQNSMEDKGPNFFPTSTEAVLPLIKGTNVKLIARFNDMVPGFPYQWNSYTDWIQQVASATQQISENYKDQILCIEVFNEPDNKFQGNFMSDPALPDGTYDQKVDWLWTQTVKKIRSIDSTIAIMGPNYENYRPWERNGEDQKRMHDFLENAVATKTVPDYIGWHSLGPSPGDVPYALSAFYRPLEKELNVPGRPKKIIIDEYGPGSGDFEGVPGTVVKHLSEFERSGINYACEGIYTNNGLLGNILRYTYGPHFQPNGGWYLFHWYKEMKGEYVPVSRWDQRYYQSYDGMASYDSTAKTVNLIFGGSNDDADIKFDGVGPLLGNKIRVKLDYTCWDVFSHAPNATVENGGDPQTDSYNIFDKTLTTSGGTLTVPVHKLKPYNAYHITLYAAGSGPSTNYPTKYEAENASLNDVAVHRNALLASNNAYVGGINNKGSSYIQFKVKADSAGIYKMKVRYANSTADTSTHKVTVNNVPSGVINYPPTRGWSDQELDISTKRILLKKGSNIIKLEKDSGYAEVDYIDLRPDTHRYDAAYAEVNNSDRALYTDEEGNAPDYVGSINFPNSYVEFNIEAPQDGIYELNAAYANGTGDTSSHYIAVNDQVQDTIYYAPTGGWLGPDPNQDRGTAGTKITLKASWNKVRFTKGEGYAELNYVRLELPSKQKEKVENPKLNLPDDSTYYHGQEAVISCATDSSVIHYTLDGSQPTAASPIYDAPLYINQRTTIKAIAFRQGFDPSNVVTKNYDVDIIADLNAALKISPNPAHSQVNISWRGALSPKVAVMLAIYNPEGAMVKKIKLTNTDYYDFDASSLPAGIYFVNLSMARGSLHGKFMLSK